MVGVVPVRYDYVQFNGFLDYTTAHGDGTFKMIRLASKPKYKSKQSEICIEVNENSGIRSQHPEGNPSEYLNRGKL